MRFVVILFLTAAITIATSYDNDLKLMTASGKIVGSFMTSRLGKKIYSFRGLRYAEPPVGKLRFELPVPVTSWNGLFNATIDGPSCPQPVGSLGSEDCLRLNVYSSKLPLPNSKINPKRPVIVFFHPGGFFCGSGHSAELGPQYLLDQEIVLVTVNYRLGLLGFLSTGDALAPGNLGFKDQVESLRWVKKNIAAFGGDPDCVTIAGNDAGASTVSLFLVSPMTTGLFHRAIAMSGSAFYLEPIPHGQKSLAVEYAESLDCPTNTTAKMLACFRNRSAEEMVKAFDRFEDWHQETALTWKPVVEPEVPGIQRFLTGQPADLIKQGKFHRVPVMTGVTKDELGSSVVYLVHMVTKGNSTILNDLEEKWNTIAPISISYEKETPRSQSISHALKQLYFKGQPIGLSNIQDLANFYADPVNFQVRRLVTILAAASSSPIYQYQFVYQGRYSFFVWIDTKKPYGVGHGDDMLYLFYMSQFPFFEATAPEIKTIERLTAIWAHFAKTGQPIPPDDPKFANVTWAPYTMKNAGYLEIGDDLSMKNNLNDERMKKWEHLFPL